MVTLAPSPRGMLRPFPLHPVAESTMLVNPQRRPARPASRSFASDQPTLLQFVLLSMLLHVLLIVLFGNPTGGARRNEGWPGPLDVTLRRLSPEAGPSFRLAPGTAPAQRAPLQAPRRLERSAPEEIDQRLTPPAAAPAKIERVAPPQSERQLAPPVVVPNRALPAAPAAAIERVAPPQIEREVAPPVELPPRAVPAAPPVERVAPAVAPARPQALPAAPVPPSRFGAPDADEEIFKPRRDVGATPSEAPRIDLDAARKKAAREIAREGSGSRGVFTVPSPPLP